MWSEEAWGSLGLDILFMAGKNNRFGSGEISNMFDFSHGPNRPQPTLTGCLGLRKLFQTDPQKPLIGSLSHVVEHPHKTANVILNFIKGHFFLEGGGGGGGGYLAGFTAYITVLTELTIMNPGSSKDTMIKGNTHFLSIKHHFETLFKHVNLVQKKSDTGH